MARDVERGLPDRKLPTSTELSRFMEILFDQGERQEAISGEPTSGKHQIGRGLEVDLPAAPAAPARPAGKDMSIDKLLKRFGIK
jgi:hypothetical protein